MAEYTEKMIEALRADEVLTFDRAEALANNWNISVRSVIAKARALEIPYEGKTLVRPKKRVTKAELAEAVEAKLGTKFRSLHLLVIEDLETLLKLL
jgi:thioesterase domain-containing protein